MSEFGKLLGSSRLAQMSRPLKRHNYRKTTTPSQQIIETREAALARQEWGVKYALPSKIKSRYITFTELDSLERLVDFETNAGHHYRRQRFQEMGVVPTVKGTTSNPLFNKIQPKAHSKNILEDAIQLSPSLAKKRVQAVLDQLRSMRPELKEHLIQRVPKELAYSLKKASSANESIPEKFENVAFEFLLSRVKAGNENHVNSVKVPGYKIAGTGGLSYALSGRLRNSPNGFINKEVVPGRILGDGITAVGGFVASTGDRQRGFGAKEPREIITSQEPISATIDSDGSVKVVTVGFKPEAKFKRSVPQARRAVSNRSAQRSSKPTASAAYLSDLIALLNK